jgi:hypothetical protein
MARTRSINNYSKKSRHNRVAGEIVSWRSVGGILSARHRALRARNQCLVDLLVSREGAGAWTSADAGPLVTENDLRTLSFFVRTDHPGLVELFDELGRMCVMSGKLTSTEKEGFRVRLIELL